MGALHIWSVSIIRGSLIILCPNPPGHTPYPDVNLGSSYEAFVSYLKAGNRMQQPESSPASLYVTTHILSTPHPPPLSLAMS